MTNDPLANQRGPGHNVPDLEPLATYLEPEFGNVYADACTWTPELRQAVTSYLVNEVADDAYEAVRRELEWDVPKGTRGKQAVLIVDHHESWQVAYACHVVAVMAVPALSQLLEALSGLWDYEDWRWDTTVWFQIHATYDQLRDMVRGIDRLDLMPQWQPHHRTPAEYEHDAFLDLSNELPNIMTPPVLFDAWQDITGPAPTDLTDQEWALLEPFLPKNTTASKPPIVRQATNGMLWRQAHPGNLPLPTRYGSGPNVNARKANYRKWGVFARMLTGLEGKPEAERLVAWLRGVVGTERKQ